MSISYRKRGKQQLWDYRIFDKNKKVIASNSGFKTKTEAKQEAMPLEVRLLSGLTIDKNITLHQLWEKWYHLRIVPQNKKTSTVNKHKKRGQLINNYFKETPFRNIKASQYQDFINQYAKTNCKDNVSRLNSEVKQVLTFAKQDKIDFHDFTINVNITGLPPKKSKDERYIHSKADYMKLLNHLSRIANYKTSVVPYLIYISNLKQAYALGKHLA